MRGVLQGSGGNDTAELWIPFSPPLPITKAWWLSVICSGRNVCVCLRMRVCVRMCLAMRNGIRKGKKSFRHFCYRCRQMCSEKTKLIFLTYFVSSFSHIAHCSGHQNETFCHIRAKAHASAVSSHLKFLSAATQVGIAQAFLVIFLHQKVTYPIQVCHTVWRRNDFCTYPVHLLGCNLRRDLL